MITHAARRKINFTCLALIVAVSAVMVSVLDVVLYDTAFLTGWVLLSALIVLTAFNGKKKIPFIPIGTSAMWLQFHIYTGIFSVILFGLHIEWRLPVGNLEACLTVLFLVVALSGVVGLILSRTIPPRLTTRGETILFDRIPVLIADLRKECEAIVTKSVTETDSRTVADFYAQRLAWFFHGPRHMLSHLLLSDRPLRKSIEEINSLERFATDTEEEFLEELAELTRQKTHLDYQYSLQAILKAWLFVHIPATFSLLIVAGVHVVLVHAFDGGL